MNIFKEAKKLGIDIASSDGMDYEIFYRKVVEARKDARENKTFWIFVFSTLANVISVIFNLYLTIKK